MELRDQPGFLSIMGNVCVTTTLASHKHTVAMAMARPRMRVGKISANSTQVTGPTDKAKQAM